MYKSYNRLIKDSSRSDTIINIFDNFTDKHQWSLKFVVIVGQICCSTQYCMVVDTDVS